MPVSPASRAVVLVAKAINVELELREIDISRGEQMTPEFLKVRIRNHLNEKRNKVQKRPVFIRSILNTHYQLLTTMEP